MPRTARVAPGGVLFHVINRGNARSRLFGKEGDYAAFEKVLGETVERFSMRLLAYCVMPNHWHLVLWPRADGDLGRFMQRLTVTHVRRWHGHHHSTGQGHLYQGTYKSFPIQADEHLLAVLRYVQRNPLRAGLAGRAQDWRWGSLWVETEGDEQQRGMLSDWPLERPTDWLRTVNRPQNAKEEEALRTSIVRGRPYGDEAWQARTARRLGLGYTFRPRGRPTKGYGEGNGPRG